MSTPRRRSIPRVAPLVLLVAAAALPYARLPSCPVYPDAERATRNAIVRGGSAAAVVTADFWGHARNDAEATGSYRPSVSLTYWLQARLWGGGAAPLHLFDMALHAAAVLLLYGMLGLALGGGTPALLAALVFAVHPALSEAVASVVGRADLLAGASFLGALLSHRRAARSAASLRWEAGALVLLAVALFSKEYAVVFPFLLLLVDLVLPVAAGSDRRAAIRRFGVWMLVVLGLYLAVRIAVLGSLGRVPLVVPADTPLAGYSLLDRLANAVWLLGVALRLLVVPAALDHVYGVGTVAVASGIGDPRALASVALWMAAAALAGWHWRRRGDGVPFVALVLFALPLLPALNTVGVTVILFAERFLYVPAMGFALGLAWLLQRATRRTLVHRVVTACVLLVAVVFALRTARRVEDWRSNEALARSALRAHPRSAMALHEVGMMHALKGEFAAAEPLVRASLEVQSRPLVWRNYSLLLERMGRTAEAREAWNRFIETSRMPPPRR
jgi:hypothetical protein